MEKNKALVSEVSFTEFESITTETPHESVQNAFENLRKSILEEIEVNKEDGVNYLKAAKFFEHKIRKITLWIIQRLYDTGSLPEFDYGSLGRAHELPGPGYTPKHAIFIIAKRMAESTSLKLIETVEIIKLISQKSTILIRKKPKRGFPLYEKSRLPMVYFEPHYSRELPQQNLCLDSACELLIAEFKDLGKLLKAYEVCVQEGLKFKGENDDALLFLLKMGLLFRSQHTKITEAHQKANRDDIEALVTHHRREKEKMVSSNLDVLKTKFSNQRLTSEEVEMGIFALSTKPRENLSQEIISGYGFFSEMEAENLLVMDKFGSCILDYFVFCIHRFGRCGQFSDVRSLIEAIQKALPRESDKTSLKSLAAFERRFVASQFQTLWIELTEVKTIDRNNFELQLEKLESLIKILAELKQQDSWMALIGFIEGDSMITIENQLKQLPKTSKNKIKTDGDKKKFIPVMHRPDLKFKKGLMIKKLAHLLIQKVDITSPGSLSFFQKLSDALRIPLKNIRKSIIRFHFSKLNGSRNLDFFDFLSKFDQSDIEKLRNDPEFQVFKDVFPEYKDPPKMINLLCDGIRLLVKSLEDAEKAKRMFENLNSEIIELVPSVREIASIERSVEKSYPRFISIALDEAATLHSEVADCKGDKKQCFLDFLFSRYLLSIRDDYGIINIPWIGCTLPWISQFGLFWAMYGKSQETGNSLFYDFDWRSEFSVVRSTVRTFPAQISPPEKIVSELANFAILLRTMALIFNLNYQEQEQIAITHASSFKLVSRKLSNLGQYVLGAAEGCYHNSDILGDIYLPFMRGAMRSLPIEKRTKEYLSFLAKFYEDPEFCNGIDEEFIIEVVKELKEFLQSPEASETNRKYTEAVLSLLPEDARILPSDDLRKLKILATSCKIKDITRVTDPEPQRKLPTKEDLVECSMNDPKQLGPKLVASALKEVIDFSVHASAINDLTSLNAILGCIIQKRSTTGLIRFLECLKSQNHEGGITFAQLLYSESHEFFASREINEEDFQVRPSINRELVHQVWPSLSFFLAEIFILQSGSVTTEKPTISGGIWNQSLVSVLTEVNIDELKLSPVNIFDAKAAETLKQNFTVYQSIAQRGGVSYSKFYEQVEPVVEHLFEAVKKGQGYEHKHVSDFLKHHKTLITTIKKFGIERSAFRGLFHHRFVYGIDGVKEDDAFNLTALKDEISANKKRATKKLAELIRGVSADEKKLLFVQLAKNNLLGFTLPLLVYFKPFLDILNQLTKSISNFHEVYSILKDMINPVNGTQAGYMILNNHAKLIYRPFYYGDKPSGEIDFRMMAPSAVRFGLALFFFGAANETGSPHNEFFTFVEEKLKDCAQVRKGVNIFLNELNEIEIAKTGNKKYIRNLDLIKKLFDISNSFGGDFDRSNLKPFIHHLYDYEQDKFQNLKSVFLKKQQVKISTAISKKLSSLADQTKDETRDIPLRFNLSIPNLILDSFSIIESKIADCVDKWISLSSTAPIKPKGIVSVRNKTKNTIEVESSKIHIGSNEEDISTFPSNAFVILLDTREPKVENWPMKCSFILKDDRVEVSISERAHPSFFKGEVLEGDLARITSPLRKAITDERLMESFSDSFEETLSKLKSKSTSRQRSFITAFSMNGTEYLRRDLELCDFYFKLKEELRQHKTALDFGELQTVKIFAN